jgi:DUF4097 and DUF4098 domain-containing protein YvlB
LPAILIPLLLLMMATAVLGQQPVPETTVEIVQQEARWFLIKPTAEDLMDSLWRFHNLAPEAPRDGLGKRSQRTVQLYHKALDRYLLELPRVQISRQTWHRWWEDFGRQQDLFWRTWQARFDSVFEQDLEAIWADPIERRLETSISLADVSNVEITHQFGDVIITGIDQEKAHLIAEIQVVASSATDAQEYIREIDIPLSLDGSGLLVATSMPPQQPASVQATTVSLQLELPQDLPLEVENSFGDIQVQGCTGGLKARTCHGALVVRDCAGDLELTNRNGSISIQDSKGNLRAKTSFGPIIALRIQGDVHASNDFGDVTVREITGAAELKTSEGLIEIVGVDGDATVNNHLGQIIVQQVAGNLTVDNAGSPVRIAEVSGGTYIESRRGEVHAEKLGGDVVILNREGNVELALDEIHQRLYRLDSAHGIIRINLPSRPSAQITAETLYGTIDSDFPLEIKRVGSTQSATGKLGGGQATIQLDARNSNIYLISSGR